MDYREAILSEEIRIENNRFCTTDYNEFLSYLLANTCDANAQHEESIRSTSTDSAYSVLSENTPQLFETMNGIQHNYSLYGFCNKCDMYELSKIIVRNMKLEELCMDDDDEYIDSEHDDF